MIASGVKVYLASQPVDFRKGPDGLLSLVRDVGADPFNGALYVFRAKRADSGEKALLLACCWAHLRRRFYELHVAGSSSLATATVERMKDLWLVEDQVRGTTPDDRSATRRQSSAPIVAELFALWEKELSLISGKSKLAEHIRYALERRASFELFLADGRVEIDSNIVERAIRPQTITRKNALFAGSDGGGRTWATIATLLSTAKMNGVDPFGWLKQTLERIAGGFCSISQWRVCGPYSRADVTDKALMRYPFYDVESSRALTWPSVWNTYLPGNSSLVLIGTFRRRD